MNGKNEQEADAFVVAVASRVVTRSSEHGRS